MRIFSFFPLGDSLDLHPYGMLLGKTSATHRSCMTLPLLEDDADILLFPFG